MNDKADNSGGWFCTGPYQSPYLNVNLEFFRRRYPAECALVEQSADALKHYSFRQYGPQKYECRDERDGLLLYEEALIDKQIQSAFLRSRDYIQKGLKLLLIAGSGLGYLSLHLNDIYQSQDNQTLVVIENRPELILAQFIFFNCVEVLKCRNIHWVVDRSLFAGLEARFREEAFFALDERMIYMMPERRLNEEERRFHAPFKRWYAAGQEQYNWSLTRMKEGYDERVKQPANLVDGCVWGASPMEAYAHAPLLRSLVSGFEPLGMKSRFLDMKNHCTTDTVLQQDLIEHCPDLYLLVHTASQGVIPKTVDRPRVIWILDHPKHFHWEKNKELFYQNDFIFYSDRRYEPYYQQTNACVSKYIPVCPSINRLGSKYEKLAAPVMFVGQLNPARELLRPVPDHRRGAVLEIAECMMSTPGTSVADAFEAVNSPESVVHEISDAVNQYTATIRRAFGSDADKLEYFFYALTNNYKRERVVSVLLDLGLVVYGPEKWLPFLGAKHAGQFRGWLEHDTLADAYASAEICVNIHSIQCPTCLNSRDMDVLAAGGCLVSDEVEDMHTGLIEPGSDFVMYRTPEELRGRVQELLEDKERREAVRAQGHQTYLQKHTPSHRASIILDTVREHYRFGASSGLGAD